MSATRVLIVDDHELVRLALRTVIDEEPDLTVVGEAATGDAALELLASCEADVVLLDLRMPGTPGVQVCEAIRARWPSVRVIVLTSYDEDEEVFGVLGAGAAGYLMKDSSPDTVLQAIRTAAQGNTVLDPAIARRVISAPHTTPLDDAGLSAREHEVLDLMARGMTNLQIAHSLWVSEATVKTHVSRILHKLRASDRAQAVLEAVRRGLVRLDG
ncbi:MAG: response regulator transcription factor [Coriobacteriia bacterium]|nr:response regulator transcription factor [Coriobacteriia bacterium]